MILNYKNISFDSLISLSYLYWTFNFITMSISITQFYQDPPGKYMFKEYLWNIPMRKFGKSSLWNSGEHSQIMYREYCSWNIRGTFLWCISTIFRNGSIWNCGEYSQIIFREYWIQEYSLIVTLCLRKSDIFMKV